MPGALVAVLLFASLLLVHFSMRAEPMPANRPLNVDRGLPLPEAGQASTVFSLTALFGAYLGIYLILGLVALAGLAVGTVLALFGIRAWIIREQPSSFEEFLEKVIGGTSDNAQLFGVLLIAMQIGYAGSEMLILRDLAKLGLGMRPEHATLLALGLAIVGYFYVLLGGYRALFRTDVLQFVLVAGLGLFALSVVPPFNWFSPILNARPGYWEVGGNWQFLRMPFIFLIAVIMGFGFLVTSPDVWKRADLVVRSGTSPRRFAAFIAAGTVPFLILIPIANLTPAVPDGVTDVGVLFAGLLQNRALFVVAALGLVACFLSAYTGAFISAVHVGLIGRRGAKVVENETPRFHWLMAAVLLVITSFFLALVQLGNSYLVATVLLGVYSLTTGLVVGSAGRVADLRIGAALWIAVFGSVLWFVVLMKSHLGTMAPTTYELNLIPPAVGLSLLTAVATRLLRQQGITHA